MTRGARPSLKSRVLNREGFWKGDDIELPWPIENNDEWHRKEKFLKCLAVVQSSAVQKHYRGFSTCRCCKQPNGSSEYVHAGWTWPSGFKHYIEEHRVRPSLAFEEMILREGEKK